MSPETKEKSGMAFQGKVVVITGGAQGIGRCCAECFEREGAIVHVIDIRQGPWFVGDLADKEEFSVFQNEHNGEKLRRTIQEFENFDGIDVCGIATDYCVYQTVKDLIEFYPAEKVRVVTNCIAAVDENDTKLAKLMKEKGIKGIEF